MPAVEGIYHTSSWKHHNQQLDLALDSKQCELAFAYFHATKMSEQEARLLYTFILHRPIIEY